MRMRPISLTAWGMVWPERAGAYDRQRLKPVGMCRSEQPVAGQTELHRLRWWVIQPSEVAVAVVVLWVELQRRRPVLAVGEARQHWTVAAVVVWARVVVRMGSEYHPLPERPHHHRLRVEAHRRTEQRLRRSHPLLPPHQHRPLRVHSFLTAKPHKSRVSIWQFDTAATHEFEVDSIFPFVDEISARVRTTENNKKNQNQK